MPGNNEAALGTLTFSKNLSLTTGSTVVMKTISTANDQLKVDGTLFLNGNLELRNLSGSWTEGKSYTLFVAPVISGSFTTISPAVPAEGLVWDTSRINEGVISVKIPSGVSRINASHVRVYPQPVVNHCFITLENDAADKMLVEVFSAKGEKQDISLSTTAGNIIKLDMSNLIPGLYVLKLTNADSAIYTCKLLKK